MGLESATYISQLVNTNPVGTDDRSTADDHMRLIKAVLQSTFPNANGAILPTPAEFNRLDGITSSTVELNKLDGFTGGATQLNRLNSIAGAGPLDAFPSGTLMTFQQTAAPTGWTKQTTHDNKAFRVVSGAAGSGGTSSFSTVFGLQAVDGHTLVEAEIPTHDHGEAGAHTHTFSFLSGGSSGTGYIENTSTASSSDNGAASAIGSDGEHTHTAFGGGSPAHSHNIELRVQYVDLIIASKNA